MNYLMEKIKEFNKERDWDKFHSPENLAKSIAIESGELLECFQWDSENYNKEEVCEELADVFTYCIQMAMKLNVNPEEIILKKLEKTKKKYPVDTHFLKCIDDNHAYVRVCIDKRIDLFF